MKFRFLLTVKLFYFLKFLGYKIPLYTLSCGEKRNEANKFKFGSKKVKKVKFGSARN